MTDPKNSPRQLTGREYAWVLTQLVLGIGQMAGAVAGVYLLLTTGVSDATLGVVFVATALAVTSRLLFRGRAAIDIRGRDGTHGP